MAVENAEPLDEVSVAPLRDATRLMAMGQLTDPEPDTMTLHTKDAFGLFTGRRADSEGTVTSIVGAKRFAAVLKSIWHLSANDNPYADWILIRMYEGLATVREHLARVTKAQEQTIERLAQKGLALSVLASRSPISVSLGFRSPYGYATAEAIVEFDYYVRMIKTLVYKDRMSDAEGRAAIREIEQLELRLEELQVSAVPAVSLTTEKPTRQAPVRRALPEHTCRAPA